VGGVAIDLDRGQGIANGAKICAGQLDVSTWERGGWHHIVDAWGEFSGGLGSDWGHG
jgi:hypothetical protein